MALPTSGPLTLAQIQTEFGGSNPISLSEYYAGGANVPAGTSGTNGPVPSSGQIAISNFYGTQKNTRVTLSYTFSGHTADASLNLSSISGYSAGQSDITVTVNSGIYLYATSTGSYGLNISGGTTGDTLVIVNNGFIMGQGGTGAQQGNAASGGPALNLGFGMSSCTINNTNGSAYIGGGGGGGGGGYAVRSTTTVWCGGGGGAGGAPGGYGTGSTHPTYGGGGGGGIGSSGGAGTTYWNGNVNATPQPQGGGSGGGGGFSSIGISARVFASGGGGGRIFPGSGGSGGNQSGSTVVTGTPGGSANAGSSNSQPWQGCGGGGWGASGGSGTNQGYAGGSGGKAVNTNGKSITWSSGDTSRVYGAVG